MSRHNEQDCLRSNRQRRTNGVGLISTLCVWAYVYALWHLSHVVTRYAETTNLRRSGGSGFRTLDSRIRSVIWIATKIVPPGPWAMHYPSKKFRQNPFTSLRVIRRTDRQTDQTKNITSFFGGGNKRACLLYPPSEWSELARYHMMLFSFRTSFRLWALSI